MAESPTIAVINHDPALLALIQHLLTSHGYHAQLHNHSSATFPTLRRFQPSLVLLDIPIEQPGSAWQLLDLLTLDPATEHIPVMIVTFPLSAPANYTQHLSDLGHYLVTKPLRSSQLISSISTVLQGGSRP